jgi:hypothetical protein
MAVSVSSPVYSRKGSPRGVLSADLLLQTLGEKLRDAVESMQIDRVGRITASFGCAALVPGKD